MGTGRQTAEAWERLLAGADGMVHAASCCAPDAWLTDLRTSDASDQPVDEPVVVVPAQGRVHVIGTTC